MILGFLTRMLGLDRVSNEGEIGGKFESRGFLIILVKMDATLQRPWTAHAKLLCTIEPDDDFTYRTGDLFTGLHVLPEDAVADIQLEIDAVLDDAPH